MHHKAIFYSTKKRKINNLIEAKTALFKVIDKADSISSSLISFKPLAWSNESEFNDFTYHELWNAQAISCDEAIVFFSGLCGSCIVGERAWDKIICFIIFKEEQEITLKHHIIYDASLAADLQVKCREFSTEISSRSKKAQNLMNVSTYLIQPVLAQISDWTSKLVITGNDEFQFIPWSTVYIEENFKSGEIIWLVEKYASRIIPSLSILLLLKRREMRRNKSIPFDFLIAGMSSIEKINSYLYWSGFEVDSIADLHSTNCIKDEIVDNQFSNVFRTSDIVHFSGHANYQINEFSNALDKVYLRLYKKKLSASMILNGELQSSTVKAMILSACLTGQGDLTGAGSEVLGLERALFYAGVSSLITTLWEVDDLPTSILMIKFHSVWKQHDNSLDHVATSLQSAQIWLRHANWQELKQEIKNLGNAIKKCSDTYSILIEHAQNQNNESDALLLIRRRERYLDLQKCDDHDVPFQHPYYWAAFQVKGVG
jgi:CHAT domain-containing protein